MRFASQNSGCMRTSRTVIVHTLGKVDGVENGDSVFCPLQKLSHLANQAAFRVSNDIRAVKLHDIRLAEKPCLSAARAADNKNILISCVLRVFGAVGHHQPFRGGQQHIVVKDRINERLDVCRCTPPDCRSWVQMFSWTAQS